MDTTLQVPALDGEGYLVEPQDWSEALAIELARRENISLVAEHWDVLCFMRQFYEEHQIAPDARYVIKHLEQRFGKESRKRLFQMFPYGYVQQACRIAGMKRPRAWSTG